MRRVFHKWNHLLINLCCSLCSNVKTNSTFRRRLRSAFLLRLPTIACHPFFIDSKYMHTRESL